MATIALQEISHMMRGDLLPLNKAKNDYIVFLISRIIDLNAGGGLA